jgi:uncharacterized phage protein gp47/JayE
MAGLDPTGFSIKTLPVINQEMEDAIHQGISPTLNLSSTSALGQLKGVTASHLSEVWDAALALWKSWDVDSAEDAALDRIAALTGSRRNPAVASQALMTITLEAGTYVAHSLTVNPVGDPNTRFDNSFDITVPTAQTLTGQLFEATVTGPINVPAGQLSVITSPVTGFSGPTNPSAVVPGSERESNAAFRQRRELELALKGSTTVDAIRADLLQTVGPAGTPVFSFVSVIENDTDATVDGVPPHSFEALVIGGTNEQVWDALLAAKPAGIRAHGAVSGVALDSQSNPHTLGFSRPANNEVNFYIIVDAVAGRFAGAQAVADAVTDYFEQNQSVGSDVIHSAYVREVMKIPGVVDAAVHVTGGDSYPVGGPQVNVVIGPREVAVLGDSVPFGVAVGVNFVPGVP